MFRVFYARLGVFMRASAIFSAFKSVLVTEIRSRCFFRFAFVACGSRAVGTLLWQLTPTEQAFEPSFVALRSMAARLMEELKIYRMPSDRRKRKLCATAANAPDTSILINVGRVPPLGGPGFRV